MKSKVCGFYGGLLVLIPIFLIGYPIIILPGLITGQYIIDTDTLIVMDILTVIAASISYVLLYQISESMKYRRILKNIFFGMICLMYFISAFYLMFCKLHDIHHEIHLIPLSGILPAGYEILSMDENFWSTIAYYIYHTVIFAPLGAALYCKLPVMKKFCNYFVSTSIIVVLCNILQFLMGKNSLYTDNIILSLLGCVIAYLICEKIKKKE